MIIYLYVVVVIIIIIQLFGVIIGRNAQITTEKIIERDIGANCGGIPIRCNPDDKDYCRNTCNSIMDYECQKMEKTTEEGRAFSNAFPNAVDDYYCLPKKPDTFECNASHGGIPVWQGWGNTESQSWGCLCSYPNYFGGPGCSNTPGVCSIDDINFMDYDYLKLGRSPQPSDCKLNSDIIPNINDKYEVLVRSISDGSPLIIPKRLVEADSSSSDNKYYRGYKSLK